MMGLRKWFGRRVVRAGVFAIIVGAPGGMPSPVVLRADPQQASKQDDTQLPAQAVAEATRWKWVEGRTTPEYCAEAAGRGYKVVVEPASPFWHTVHLSQDGKAVYSWTGHRHSVFVIDRDVLYYADFHSAAHGCAVVAYDLKSRKRVWKTRLRGIRVTSHSKYSNLINIAFNGNLINIYGKESFGRYIELLDPKTGQTVGHRLVPKDEKAPAPPPKLEQEDAGRP